MLRVGLVLGGGGVRAMAHIGVLRELDRLGIRPGSLSGIGVGGIIAALYACQCDWAEAEEDIVHAVMAAESLSPRPAGVRLLALLTERLGDVAIEDLPLPLTLTAFNLSTGRVVPLGEGPLLPALRATTAWPGFSAPAIDQRGNVLVNARLVINVFSVPSQGVDRVIAVDTAARRRLEGPPGAQDQARKLLSRDRWLVRLAHEPWVDFLLQPVTQVGALALREVRKCIAAGAREVVARETDLLGVVAG